MCVKLWHVMYITDNDPVVMKRHGFLFSLGLHMYHVLYIQYMYKESHNGTYHASSAHRRSDS